MAEPMAVRRTLVAANTRPARARRRATQALCNCHSVRRHLRRSDRWPVLECSNNRKSPATSWQRRVASFVLASSRASWYSFADRAVVESNTNGSRHGQRILSDLRKRTTRFAHVWLFSNAECCEKSTSWAKLQACKDRSDYDGKADLRSSITAFSLLEMLPTPRTPPAAAAILRA